MCLVEMSALNLTGRFGVVINFAEESLGKEASVVAAEDSLSGETGEDFHFFPLPFPLPWFSLGGGKRSCALNWSQEVQGCRSKHLAHLRILPQEEGSVHFPML